MQTGQELFLIRYPSSKEPTKMPEFHETKKLAWALEEFEKIHSVLDVLTVYKLNKAIEEDRIKDVIMLAEALHEKKIANIADDIAKRKNVKMVTKTWNSIKIKRTKTSHNISR